MTNLNQYKKLFFILMAAISLSAFTSCADKNTELASKGETGDNPGTGGGGTGGGGGGGGTVVQCTPGSTVVTLGTGQACQISGVITQDMTLNAANTYLLNGKVTIGQETASDGTGGTRVTLNIPAGTTIAGLNATSFLVIARGSQINATGTVGQPITFTSSAAVLRGSTATTNALDEAFTAEWGGLVINGLATINTCATGICEASGEGDSGLYGGADDNDSSGTMRYVRVLYAGNPITDDDELNGIAFEGVGRGTTLEFIHVHNGADDGVEFFGGTADIKNLIITGADDDSLDWTNGWRGRAQHVLIMQNDNQSASDQGIEADSNDDDNDATPIAQPTLANLTIIGGNTQGDIGMLLREGTGANIYNAVITNFNDGCLDIDNAATFARIDSAPQGIDIESTLLGCDTPFISDTDSDAFGVAAWFNGQPNNATAPDTLSGFINGVTEQGVTATDVNAIDTWFDTTTYIGAVNGAAIADNWTQGWSYAINPAPVCPAGTTPVGTNGCILQGVYTQDLNLVAGLDYFLRGKVVIGEDVGPDAGSPNPAATAASITINAGVVLEGEDPQSFLVISRGSQIFSNGTQTSPVIMTAINDETRNLNTDTALWGGLVINGRATINTCGVGICEAAGEGDSGLYGGNDDNDDSGHMFYTVLKYAGNPITDDDELNGVAFEGVGRGTEVDYLQVHNGADDGVEFFGGTVRVKHLVVTGSDDDSIDWTNGWRGAVQHAVVVQNDNQSASDQGIEADSNDDDNDATPIAQPMLSNITLIGGNTQGDVGMLLREGTGANIYNTVVTNFNDGCLDIDNAATFGRIDSDPAGIDIESTLLGCTTPFVSDTDSDAFGVAAWFNAQPNNSTAADSLTAPAGGSHAYINGGTENGVTITDPNAIDPWFDTTTHIGAVGSAGTNWLQGWTVWVNN